MPSRTVEIEWDEPEDENWLNKHNIELALSTYCKNTEFKVRDIKNMEMEMLANYLLSHWQEEFGKGEDPGAGESAVDMAIRLLRRYKEGG